MPFAWNYTTVEEVGRVRLVNPEVSTPPCVPWDKDYGYDEEAVCGDIISLGDFPEIWMELHQRFYVLFSGTYCTRPPHDDPTHVSHCRPRFQDVEFKVVWGGE